MFEAFTLGGWGMWFILIFGVLAVITSARFAFRGEQRLEAFGRWMAVTTVSSAIFGFLAGMIKVAHYVAYTAPAPERAVTFVEGFGEASHCLALGFLLTTLTCLLLAVGHRRFRVVVSGESLSPLQA
jgi:hypothetical protein